MLLYHERLLAGFSILALSFPTRFLESVFSPSSTVELHAMSHESGFGAGSWDLRMTRVRLQPS